MKLASSIKYYCEERSLRILVYKDRKWKDIGTTKDTKKEMYLNILI